MEEKAKICNIHCTACNGPAKYDILSHFYKCQYCGGKVGVDEAIKANQGFRSIQKQKLNESLENFELETSTCTGCGAEIVFDKGDAISHCAFCGRELVREEYVKLKDIPELIIPFSITKDEAKDLLSQWCKKNHSKKEAREILKNADKITGCYLPYELVKGPVYCFVSRFEEGGTYECDGYVDGIFVNCSKNLDNLLLDGMEPYNLDEITEFDFAYVAGHQVKVPDITGSELSGRIAGEVEQEYRPIVQRTLETRIVNVDVGTRSVVRMPVLLPVYYISFGKYMAAVNGQTGKVSVRSIHDSFYYTTPWWIRATSATNITMATIMLGMKLFGAQKDLLVTAGLCLWAFFIIVMLCAYSDRKQKWFKIKRKPRIFTSKGGPYVREEVFPGKPACLVQSGKKLKKPEISKPVFVMDIDGEEMPVVIRFTTLDRIISVLFKSALVLFFPVIVALFVNGFKFSQIWLGGSAVWFCLTVPLIPVFIVKYGRMELYDNPWIFIIQKNGRKKRYHNHKHPALADLFGLYSENSYKNRYEKYGKNGGLRQVPKSRQKKNSGEGGKSGSGKNGKINKGIFGSGVTVKELFTFILKALFKPKLCFVVWGIIIVFCTMVHLTAFGKPEEDVKTNESSVEYHSTLERSWYHNTALPCRIEFVDE